VDPGVGLNDPPFGHTLIALKQPNDLSPLATVPEATAPADGIASIFRAMRVHGDTNREVVAIERADFLSGRQQDCLGSG
jgi:hypothetical protein